MRRHSPRTGVGCLAADQMAKAIGGKVEIASLPMKFALYPTDQQVAGFNDRIKQYPSIQIVARDGATVFADGQQVGEGLLQRTPDLAGGFASWHEQVFHHARSAQPKKAYANERPLDALASTGTYCCRRSTRRSLRPAPDPRKGARMRLSTWQKLTFDGHSTTIWAFLVGAVPSALTYVFGKRVGKRQTVDAGTAVVAGAADGAEAAVRLQALRP